MISLRVCVCVREANRAKLFDVLGRDVYLNIFCETELFGMCLGCEWGLLFCWEYIQIVCLILHSTTI